MFRCPACGFTAGRDAGAARNMVSRYGTLHLDHILDYVKHHCPEEVQQRFAQLHADSPAQVCHLANERDIEVGFEMEVEGVEMEVDGADVDNEARGHGAEADGRAGADGRARDVDEHHEPTEELEEGEVSSRSQ